MTTSQASATNLDVPQTVDARALRKRIDYDIARHEKCEGQGLGLTIGGLASVVTGYGIKAASAALDFNIGVGAGYGYVALGVAITAFGAVAAINQRIDGRSLKKRRAGILEASNPGKIIKPSDYPQSQQRRAEKIIDKSTRGEVVRFPGVRP